MTDPLSRLLDRQEIVLADGAMATNLLNTGLPSGVPVEFCNIDAPERVSRLHDAMIEAGADLILTNTFGANAGRLRPHEATDRVHGLNLHGAQLARAAADAASRTVVVAGCIGPTGDIMAPMGNLDHDTAVAIFLEQARALKDGGVDLLWAETFSCPAELRALAEAALMVDLPWSISMSFEAAGRTMMGLTPGDFLAALSRLHHPPIACGANCGMGVADVLASMSGFAATGCEYPLISKTNAGIPRLVGGQLRYDATPGLMAEYALIARDMGVRIIGGCCGTTPELLGAMRAALDGAPRGPRPTRDQIAARLTPFKAADQD